MQKLAIGRIMSMLVGTMAVLAVGTAFGAVQNGTCDGEDPPNGCIESNGWVIESIRTYNAGPDTTTFAYYRTNTGGGAAINHIDVEWEQCAAGDEFSVLSSTGGTPFKEALELDQIDGFGIGTAYNVTIWRGLGSGDGVVDVTLDGKVSGKPGALLAHTGTINPPSTWPKTTAAKKLLVPACLFGGGIENALQKAVLAGDKTVFLDDGRKVCLTEDGAGGCAEVVDCTTGAVLASVPESELFEVEMNSDSTPSISTLGEICPEYFVDNNLPNTSWYCSGGRCYQLP